MDEPQVRVLLERLSDSESPPSQVSIGLARRSGRRKLRRHRAAISGTPVVAVGVLALFAGGVLPTTWHGQHRGSGPSAAAQPAAVAGFNPLVPFAAFGWLPAGDSVVSGTTARVSQYLDAGPGHRARWTVTAISAGRCNLTSGQILRRLQHGTHPQLRCDLGSSGTELFTAQRQAPSVNGHAAFQDGQRLAWEYARNSWAMVSEADRKPDLKLMVKVASGVTFGHLRQPGLKFPIQLTGLPAAWHAGSVHFLPDAGVLRGQWLYLEGKGGSDGPSVDVAPAGPGNPCRRSYPHGQRRTINGISVVVNHIPAAGSSPASFQVCAAHADGLFVLIVTSGQGQPRAVSIFRHDLRLLGRDPAHWTTRPLG
jgi:hypothetical protein